MNYNVTDPLKIVIYNNYLKKMVIKNKGLYNHKINRKSYIPIPSLKKTTSFKTFDNIINENPNLKIQTTTEEVLHINIDVKINNISDLLELIETYKLGPHLQYNINMESLHKIKQPLIELNNMVGMKELKTNIVEQIIYFIQELHIDSPDFMHTVIYGPPGTGKTEIAKIIGNDEFALAFLNMLENNEIPSITTPVIFYKVPLNIMFIQQENIYNF